MCLILLANRVHPQYQTVLAANRDEFYSRPTGPLNWHGNVLCGRDEVGGGTWFGVDTNGRWAIVTNFRGPEKKSVSTSRGQLVASYLNSNLTVTEYLQHLQKEAPHYAGFNLLISDAENICYFSNRDESRPNFDPLPPGVYGLSNHLLNTDWPKVDLGKIKLKSLLSSSDQLQCTRIFGLLQDGTIPPDDQLPDTGVGLAKERLLASMFISSDDYGTRCSTSLLMTTHGSITVAEKSFPSNEIERFEFQIDSSKNGIHDAIED